MTWHMIWTIWIIAFICSFGVIEGLALSRIDGVSLSQTIADASAAWPVLPFVFGVVVGGLAVHFWWHWVPNTQRVQQLVRLFHK